MSTKRVPAKQDHSAKPIYNAKQEHNTKEVDTAKQKGSAKSKVVQDKVDSKHVVAVRSSHKMSASQHKAEFVKKTWSTFDWRTWKVVPNENQQRAVRYAITYLSDNQMVARWDMGQGKTLLALLWAECMMCMRWRHDGQLRKCIVVAAPTIQQGFQQELKRSVGRSAEHIETFYEFWSFEIAAKRRESFLKACHGNYLVVDEVQRIRTDIVFHGDTPTSGANALAVLMGAELSHASLVMSGTIYVNALTDVHNLIHLMSRTAPRPDANPKALMSLEKQANVFRGRLSECSREPPSGGSATVTQSGIANATATATATAAEHKSGGFGFGFGSGSGFANTSASASATVMKNSKTKRVGGPKYDEILVLIEMNPEFYEAYIKVENDKQEELRRLHNEVDLKGSSAFFSGLRQAANKINSVLSQKRQFVMEIVLKAKQEKKRVVITSAFLTRGLQLLAQTFPTHGIRFVRLDGTMKEDDRQSSVNQFNDLKSDIDAIIVSGAGATGTNLKGSSIQINFESHWNEATRQQTNFRSIRLDSYAQHIQIYNLIMLKPREFWSTVHELQELMAQHPDTPGLPTKLQALPDMHDVSTQTAATALVDSGCESIDLHLFRLQLKKAKELQPAKEAMRSWSIEALFGNQTHTWAALPIPLAQTHTRAALQSPLAQMHTPLASKETLASNHGKAQSKTKSKTNPEAKKPPRKKTVKKSKHHPVTGTSDDDSDSNDSMSDDRVVPKKHGTARMDADGDTTSESDGKGASESESETKHKDRRKRKDKTKQNVKR